MGNLENSARKRVKKENLQKYILATVAVAGVLSAAVVVPNVIGAMGKLGILPGKRANERIKQSQAALIKKGWLKYEHGRLALTASGHIALERIRFKTGENKKPKKWDKQWRVLIFDIEEKRKEIRDKIRRTLLEIGFLRLQDSVWVYPYNCEDLVSLLKADFKIGHELIYIISHEIEGVEYLKSRFHLS